MLLAAGNPHLSGKRGGRTINLHLFARDIELDLKAANINTVIRATVYPFDYSIVKLPVTAGDGYPLRQRGVTQYPGLYFIGMSWLHKHKSPLLLGVGEDAE